MSRGTLQTHKTDTTNIQTRHNKLLYHVRLEQPGQICSSRAVILGAVNTNQQKKSHNAI